MHNSKSAKMYPCCFFALCLVCRCRFCEQRMHSTVHALRKPMSSENHARKNKRCRHPKVKVFDFFSGCGGASRGFQDAGMEVVFALDHDHDAQRTFIANFPNTHFELKDISDVDIHSVENLVESHRPSPILFCGCVPCQPFTKHNTILPEQSRDDRVPLLLQFLKLIEACRPDIVFIENVPGLQKLDRDTEPFGVFCRGLRGAHYQIDYKSVQLMKYGVPQKRRRLVLLASRKRPINLPLETNGPGTENPSYVTVRDSISDLPKISAGEEHPDIPNHCAARLSKLNLERIRNTSEGGGHYEWPKRFRLRCHQSISGYSDVYGRMHWDRPASGLTTRCISYSNGRFGHPEQDRAISVREAARLQTFPDDFRFEGTLNSMARQIGNAVPVRLAKIIGEHINAHLAEAM